MSAKSLFLSRLAKITGRDKVMRSSIVFGSLVGLALAVGCSRTHSQYKAPNNVQCGAGSCSVPKPVNPANIDFEVGESDDHEVTIPVAKIVKRCADGMAFVSGEYCRRPKFDQPQYDESGVGDPECEEFMKGDKPCNKGGVKPSCLFARCKRYKESSSECLAPKEHKEFCIDRYEYTKADEELPLTMVNMFQAKDICEAEGKRLCKETEWELSCTGPRTLPYSTGYIRPTGVCNIDVMHDLAGPGGRMNGKLLVPTRSMPDCHSEYGVYMLNGNADEITIRDRSPASGNSKEIDGHSLALKGGHLAP